MLGTTKLPELMPKADKATTKRGELTIEYAAVAASAAVAGSAACV